MRNQEYLEFVAMEFKVECTQQRLTIRKFADRAGVVHQTINAIENGRDSFSIPASELLLIKPTCCNLLDGAVLVLQLR